ncbi:hypothetical protein [Brevibacterium aurantiacum]|uniref:Uncharacterized protein n=1 Tax=Brevibacterium aurantiacum TaxID=273384 RepID=A0A2A3ZHN7_BREAU|nr:hypothetical protein [Brevibacterium aurantiacum]PCC51170.1 hypothetical protein CIK62_05715 [Brevibacterium aurantiacum]
MKEALRELLKDRRSLREAAIVAVLFPLVNFGLNLFGWGHDPFVWWEILLGAFLTGFFYWLFVSGFRRFRDEDVTPR